MEEMNDIFAQFAVSRHAARGQYLVAPDPIPVPKRVLPLDKKAGTSTFEPLPKLSTPAELSEKLDQLRKVMAEFLCDLAPGVPTTRLMLPLDEFDWREETESDRHDFTSTLNGAGQWERVKIPHFGPPLGRAVTYYRATFKVTPEMLQKGAVFVAFDGVDYKAHVFINHTFLGSHEGFFAPFEFDFTPLPPGWERILLVVKVENDNTFMGRLGGSMAIPLMAIKYMPPRVLGTMTLVELGWHHCPAGMGICQPVRIEARSKLFIRDVFVRPLPDDCRAEAWIEIWNCELRNHPIAFDLSLFGQNFPRDSVRGSPV